MSIYNWCVSCKVGYALEEKTCPKCGGVPEKGKQRYRVSVMVNGRQITKVVPKISMAREIESSVKTDAIRGEFVDRRAEMTLHEVWEHYHAAKSNLPRMPLYEGYVSRFFDRWAMKKLREIEPHKIELFINELRATTTNRGRPYTEATIKSIISFLSSLFNYARKTLRQRVDNPCEYIDKPREDTMPIVPLTPEQKAALVAAINAYKDKQVGNILRFALATGMRRGEIFKLLWSDVDFSGRRLTIRKAKSGRNEVIPLSEGALAILAAQKEKGAPGALVFPSPATGEQYNNFARAWTTIKKAAGVPATLRIHDLRHQFASDLVNAGVDLYAISKLLRHSKTETTKIYAHLVDDTLRAALKKIE